MCKESKVVKYQYIVDTCALYIHVYKIHSYRTVFFFKKNNLQNCRHKS